MFYHSNSQSHTTFLVMSLLITCVVSVAAYFRLYYIDVESIEYYALVSALTLSVLFVPYLILKLAFHIAATRDSQSREFIIREIPDEAESSRQLDGMERLHYLYRSSHLS